MGIKSRREEEKKMRREQILSGARTLLLSHGIDYVSMAKIAGEAELGVGTIYSYFVSKEDIFAALQKEGVCLLFEQIQKDTPGTGSYPERLNCIAMAYYRFSLDHKDYFDIINYFLSSPRIFFKEDLKKQIDLSGNKILAVIRDVVQKGMDDKVFLKTDPSKFAIAFWGMIHGLIQFRKLETTLLENQAHQRLYKYAVDTLIRGIQCMKI